MHYAHAAALSLLLCACSSDDSPVFGGATSTTSTAASGLGCVPGVQANCGCAGGGIGSQICLEDGSGFGPCSCQGEGGAGGAGTTSVTATTSSGNSGGAGGGTTCTPLESTPCYSGSQQTEGVGVCKAGSQTCNAQGTGFGPCIGEVTPTIDDCATPADEDCDGANPLCGALVFSKSFGTTQGESGIDVATDSLGNIILVATADGPLDVGGGPLAPGGGTDIVLAKFGPTGTHLWSKRFGLTNDQTPRGVAVDFADNVLIAGEFAGQVDFGGGVLTANGVSDVFIAKFSPSGDHIWSKSFSSPLGQGARDVAVDASGAALITGSFNGTVDFGGQSLVSIGDADIFVAKLDASGNHVWSKAFGSTNFDSGNVIAVDSSQDIIVRAYGVGVGVDFGGGVLATGDYVVKLGPTGSHIWSKAFGTAASSSGLAVDQGLNVFLCGQLNGTADFGGGPLSSVGNTNAYVVKLTQAGDHVWSKQFGDGASQSAFAIATDASGNIAVLGTFDGSINFGGAALVSSGADVFIAKLTGNGNHVYSIGAGDNQLQSPVGIAADIVGNIVVTGAFWGTINFGGGTMTAIQYSDIFLAKFGP